MQEFIYYGLGWLYELIVCTLIAGLEGVVIWQLLTNFRLQSKIDRMKANEELYKKELSQYETVSEEFYEKVWAE